MYTTNIVCIIPLSLYICIYMYIYTYIYIYMYMHIGRGGRLGSAAGLACGRQSTFRKGGCSGNQV